MQHATLRAGVVAALLLLTSATLSAQGTWTSLSTGTTQDLRAVQFISADVGYVVGDAGTVLKTADGGATWTDISPGGEDLYGLHFFIEGVGMVVGSGGTIRRTADDGQTWITIPSGTSSVLYSVSFADSVGIIGGGSQTILRSDNHGATWTVVQDGFFGGGFFGADMVDPSVGFVAGQNTIFQPLVGYSTDGGVSFDFTAFYLNSNEGHLTDIHFLDAQTGVTTGVSWNGQGAISRSQDGAQSWTTTLFPSPLFGLDFAAGVGYAVGEAGAILATTDGGQTWAPEPSGTAAALNAVSSPTASVAYAAGNGGTVLKRTSGPGVPLTLALTPANPPVTVAPGGAFQFTVQVANTGDEAVTFDLWAEGTRDGGGPSVTRGPRTFTLPAGVSRQVTVTQRVPQAAPPGAYTFTVSAGTFPDEVFASDSFPITVSGSEAASVTASALPERFALEQNAPNPFRGQAVIRYSLPEGASVRLRVYDALGKEVAVLVDAEQAAGRHEVTFDAADLPAGVYLYRLEAGTFQESRTMMLTK